MTPRTLYLIKRAETEVTSRMASALEKHGITPIQFAILYFVDNDKDDLSSAQLSRRFLMTPQSMNELVAVLEKKKLLKKSVDPAHRRILRISLTAKGRKLLEDCNTLMDAVEEELLQGLTNTERDALKNILGKILAASRQAALN